MTFIPITGIDRIGASLLQYARHMRQLFPQRCDAWLLPEYLGRHGQEFVPAVHQYDRGIPDECFKNATLMALDNPTLDYVEGLAFRINQPIALSHAWCAPANGPDHAYDVTLDDPSQFKFFGVRFNCNELIGLLLDRRVYGLFTDEMTVNTTLFLKLDPTLRELLSHDYKTTRDGYMN